MAFYLGIDSGGTKAAFLLTDEQGRVYARHRAGGCAVLGARKAGVKQMVSDGMKEICLQAGIKREDITALGLGISGYGEGEGTEQETLEACEESLYPGRVVCQCDTYIGWAGSLLFEPGVNIIAGTGAVVYGVDDRGKTARSSGWGAGCDEGSCSWHGQRLVEAFTKQADGRMPRTVLYNMFRERYGIRGEDAHFVMPLNREVVRGGKGLAALQLFLREAWLAGDPEAQRIYEMGAQELWLGVESVAAALGLLGTAYAVSYTGGLFKGGECALAPLRALAQKAGARLIEPHFEPEVGAVMMAIRHINRGFNPREFQVKE